MTGDRFYFWKGFYDAMQELSISERGELVTAMCVTAFDDAEPALEPGSKVRVAWLMVHDQVAESVRIGRESSENGKRGGRPPKDGEAPADESKKRQTKRGAKTTPKTTPKSTAESVKKGIEKNCINGSFQEPSAGSAPAPEGAGSPAGWIEMTADDWLVGEAMKKARTDEALTPDEIAALRRTGNEDLWDAQRRQADPCWAGYGARESDLEEEF